MHKHHLLILNTLLILLMLCIGSVVSATISSQQQIILQEINSYRLKHHLRPLQINNIITHEAQIHSTNMAKKIIPFSHTNFNQRIQHIYAKIHNCKHGAENIAYFPPKVSPREVVKLWLISSLHRRNINGNYNLTGIGITTDKRGWIYYTQTFIYADA